MSAAHWSMLNGFLKKKKKHRVYNSAEQNARTTPSGVQRWEQAPGFLVAVFPSLSLLSGSGISKRDKTLAKALLSVAECWKRDILQHREGHLIMQIKTQSTNNMRSTHRDTQALVGTGRQLYAAFVFHNAALCIVLLSVFPMHFASN